MALDPWYHLFPTVGALVFAGLAVGVFRRRRSLGGMAPDWMAAFGFGALAYGGALAAGLADWSDPADFTAAYTGAAAGIAFVAAFSGLFQRYSHGQIGAPAFRWALFAAALGFEGFGWGAIAASPGAAGDGLPASWAAVPSAAAAAALVPLGLLAARQTLGRAGQLNTLQLFLGVLLFAAGLVALGLGETLLGCTVGMLGGAFLYSGTAAVAGLAPAAAAPALRPRVDAPDSEATRGGAGVKVRVPKGSAVRVTSFRDDEPSGKDAD